MSEEKPRTLKVLEALSKMTEPTSPADIGIVIKLSPRDTGKTLYDLGKGGLAQKPDEKKSLWLITDKGRKYIENPPVPSVRPLSPTLEPTLSPSTQTDHSEPPPLEPPGEEQPDTVPSQADLFRAEGERLGFGSRKGDIKLEAVVTYVERTANLDDLGSVWNALTEMGVANDVKKRWLKLYSQNVPGAEIPPELKAKLEAGTDDKVGDKEGSPRAKRFNVIEGQIMPDPEGEFSFSQAVQKAMAEKGASSNQAAEMAATFAKMNSDTMNLLIPLLTKNPEGTSMTQLLLTQLGELQKELRTPHGESEGTQQIQALTQQLSELRDTLHNEQLARFQEQNQATTKELLTLIGRLEQQIKAASEGKQAESKIGLMSHALDIATKELTGIRSDLKPLAQTFMERRVTPGEKTPAEKAGFGVGLDKGIERAHEASELENELFFGKES